MLRSSLALVTIVSISLHPLLAESSLATKTPKDAEGKLLFENIASRAGLDFRYTFGDFAYDNIMESSGSGATWIDVDGDHWLDLYLPQGAYLDGISDPKGKVHKGAENRLFCNRGGHFEDCTEAYGLGDELWSMAAIAADYDGDGRTDLFVSNYGPNRLYRNMGGTFRDVAAEVGLAGPAQLGGFEKWTVGGSFFDADGDGDLDLAVCNFLAFDPDLLVQGREWEMPEPQSYGGQASRLYLQEPDGRFRDATADMGMLRPDSKCMGMTAVDLDSDGFVDLFQGNDHQENFLFRSSGKGRFEEVARSAGIAVNDQGLGTGSMHGTPGDVDGDGRLDLLVVDLRHGSLYRQHERMLFRDITWESGIGGLLDGHGQWGAGLQDFDLDGDLDLFTANGVAHILESQRPILAVNDGRGHFSDAREGAGPYFESRRSGRGAAFADFDNDGDIDIVVNHVDHQASVALLENRSPRAGHWIGFWLIGAGPRDALGSTLRVEAGNREILRVHQPSASYLSGNDPRIHVGLGQTDSAERVEVRWPSGKVQEWEDLPAGFYYVLEEGIAMARALSSSRSNKLTKHSR